MWTLAIAFIILFLIFAFNVNIDIKQGHIYLCYDGKYGRQVKKIL